VGSGNLHNTCRSLAGFGTEVFIVRCGQVSPRFRGQGLDAASAHIDTLAAGRAASCSGAIRAQMSTTGL
jgi:hypothetical protein